ncbi:hypothetical protein B0H67DRAFT_565296 [Lasiosphaeris hirsuta]|uniref:Golgi apparatus membrane protein TVP38 n=1 Tax=Lasiosphaeris hirsuta TaxID=260670 RepID=A0AA40EDR2_9PEZI|nr:hypothetical protein B0H67DRAFT_565296 [Lasiosphaeris hirsuta]
MPSHTEDYQLSSPLSPTTASPSLFTPASSTSTTSLAASAASKRPNSPTSPHLPSPSSQASVPPWACRPTPTTRLSTRRSTPYAVSHDPPLLERLTTLSSAISRQALRLLLSLTPLQRLALVVAGLAVLTLTILGLVYSHRIFAALGPVAQKWRLLPGGWVLVWLLAFACAFPPMIGYSTVVTVAGFVYGFPWGWPIVASATVAGSTAAFFTSRGVFSGYVHRLVGKDARFVALGQVLRRDGLGVLAMIRLSPLPYSLSNGFLATVPSIRPGGFALATACATYAFPFFLSRAVTNESSPKLAVHVFIGSRLALLVESGDKMSGADRAINYASMFFGGLMGFTVGILIYRRTMARAAELAAAGGLEEGEGADSDIERQAGDNDEEGGYADAENSRLIRGNAAMAGDVDAAALMDDDDISLWDTDGIDTSYRDSWDEEEAVGGGGRSNGDVVANGVKR